MKTLLLITLVVVLVMGATASSYAAVNPFADVPKDHWAYKAVCDLQRVGLIEGFDDGTYKGDKTMTRYRVAQFVAKVMTRLDRADAVNQEKIEKLKIEFAYELKILGVKIDKLQDEVDNMPKFSGEIRFMSQRIGEHNDTACDAFSSGTYMEERSRIYITGKINDTLSYGGRFENTQNLRSNTSKDENINYNLAWIQANRGTNTIKLGRFEYKPVYGLVADASMRGIAINGGKDFTYGLYVGKPDLLNTNNELRNVWFFNEPTMIAGEVGMKLGSNANLRAGYYDIKHTYNTTPNRHLSIFEIGGDVRVNDFKLTAAYAKANIPVDEYTDPEARKTSYMVDLAYKGADRNKKGSYGVDVSYQANGRLVGLNSTMDNNSGVANGYKGYKYGFDYTLDKNIVLKTSVVNAKGIAHPEDVYNVRRAEVFFYF